MVDSERFSDLTLSRRDSIRGAAALGTLALASRIGAYAQVVEAQITEPRIQLGSDYAFHDNGGNLVINHDPNGDILEYDATADQITTLKPLTSVTTDALNTADASAASENQTLVKGASSSDLAFLTSLMWEEDGNSPLSISSATSGTITLAGEYDGVICIIRDGSTNTNLGMQVNGSTGSYTVLAGDGSQTGSKSQWDTFATPEIGIGSPFWVSGRWTNRPVLGVAGTPFPGWIQGGFNVDAGISSPLDSITVLAADGSTSFDLTMAVYGLVD